MAEKKATKAAATKAAKKEAAAAAAPKKACAKKACATKKAEAPAKKAAAPKKAAKSIIYVNSENAGFKAGDVYQTLAAVEGAAMTPAEIAKKAKCTVEEVYLGMGWLLKEGKIATNADNKIVLA